MWQLFKPFQHLLLPFSLFAFLFLGIMNLQAQEWEEIIDTTATDGAADDRYGVSVAISGNYAVVGAFLEDEDENGLNTMSGAGAAYILEKVGGDWTEVQKIVASDRAVDDYFGISVAISGDYLVVGAQNEDEDAAGLNTLNGAGSAYVFERSGGVWSEVQKIVPTNRVSSDEFGGEVSISGDYLIVGAADHYLDENNLNTRLQAGAAYIFERDGGGTWNQVEKLVASDRDSYDFFGRGVAISGDYAIVGAPYEDEDAAGGNTQAVAGSVYLFERDGGGSWNEVQKVVASDRTSDDLYGWSVAISGDYAVVGARQEDEDAAGLNTRSNAGSAYVLERSGGGTWSQVQKIVPSDRFSQDFTGESVAIDGDRLLISSRFHDYDTTGGNFITGAGAAFLFERDGGGTWSEVQKLVPQHRVSNSFFGMCDISNGQAIVGADRAASNQGRAYIFERSLPSHPHGGYALDFDGADDFVSFTGPDLTATDFSVECWAKNQTSGVTQTIFSQGTSNTAGNAFYFGFNTSDRLFVGFIDVAYSTTETYADNLWHHVAVTYIHSTKELRVYVDGELLIDQISTSSVNGNTVARLGRATYLSGRYLTGQLDEFRIWSDIRTQAEIQAHMHKELAGSEANLTVYYPMHDGSGTQVADYTGQGSDGTLTNGPVWKTSGAHAGPGMGLDFDGSDDFVSVPDAAELDLTNDFTLEAWVYPTSLSPGTYGRIISKDLAYGWGMNSTRLRFTTYNRRDYDLTYSLPTNTWTHLAITMDTQNDVVFYVDGDSVGKITGSLPSNTTSDPVLIGSSTYSSIEDFSGRIDEVRIWNDIRTEAEIRASMYRTLDGDEEDLIAYYRFDQQADASHTTLYDQTSNGHDGTLTNMDATTDWVSSNSFTTWIGSEDNDWDNSDNWSLGTKPLTENVGVYSWPGSNDPAVNSINGHDFYLDAGVSLSHSGNLTLSGNFYNAGTFTTTGNVTFSGSEAQSIDGPGTNTFGTLTVNNASGLTLESDVTTTSSLTLTDGLLNLNGQTLTLGNSASVSGSPGATNHVNATSGNLTKGYSSTG
ncbi:MAG: LamG-like jellyroll fold domain-containing protein, partial [Bacteroidota bacterium]